MAKRPYQLKRRAQQQEATRQRIVEAAMALHEELGPRQTTISAIAERAGVQRLTVYRHFGDDLALFTACSGLWFQEHPPPDPDSWRDVGDPGPRAAAALGALYAWYRRTRGMLEGVMRDRAEVPAVDQVMRQFDGYLRSIQADLAGCWAAGGRPPSRGRDATIAHCLKFATWLDLAAEGLNETEMANLAGEWIAAAANASPAAGDVHAGAR